MKYRNLAILTMIIPAVMIGVSSAAGGPRIPIHTQKIFVPCNGGQDSTLSAITPYSAYEPVSLLPTMWSATGIELDSHKTTYGSGQFVIPTDFVSDLSICAVVIPEDNERIHGATIAMYGNCDEPVDQHSSIGVNTAAAVTVGHRNCIWRISLDDASAGDMVTVSTHRLGSHTSDIGGRAYLSGWLISYKSYTRIFAKRYR